MQEHFEGQSNEGHGWYPGANMAALLQEGVRLLGVVADTLTKVFSGGVAFRASLKLWPPGIEGHIEVRK